MILVVIYPNFEAVIMLPIDKLFVHLAIDQVDTVVFDPEGRFDPEIHDHYDTFDAARDAALTSIEVMLDEADYDGDDHREELVRMLKLLESSASFDELRDCSDYQWFLSRLTPSHSVAA